MQPWLLCAGDDVDAEERGDDTPLCGGVDEYKAPGLCISDSAVSSALVLTTPGQCVSR